MKLQLLDDDGKTVVAEFDLGVAEGEWDIHSDDEAEELLATIQKQVPWKEKKCDDESDDEQ